jgi:hypothetical protein
VTTPAVTILIPHFQTLEPVRLCLRSLRKYTPGPCIVRVLDNGSQDASIEYLRSVAWIELVETGLDNETWSSHYEALNEALKTVETPRFVVMHSDTYVRRPDWLPFLLRFLEDGFVAVGSRNQIVPCPGVATVLSFFSSWRRREWKPEVPSLRSLCVLYDTEPFREAGCRFFCREREDVTHAPNERLVERGHRICALPAWRLSPYLFHTSATTRIATGDYTKDPGKHRGEYESFIRRPEVRAILGDASLDV